MRFGLTEASVSYFKSCYDRINLIFHINLDYNPTLKGFILTFYCIITFNPTIQGYNIMRTVKPTPFPDSPELLTPNNLGDAVRAARTQSGMTLETAALTLGIAKQTLSDIELGKPTVSLGNAMLAANGLGVAMFAVPAEDREPVKFKLRRS